jgi:hypothetical protein
MTWPARKASSTPPLVLKASTIVWPKQTDQKAAVRVVRCDKVRVSVCAGAATAVIMTSEKWVRYSLKPIWQTRYRFALAMS